jgi:CHAT domain-containing protein
MFKFYQNLSPFYLIEPEKKQELISVSVALNKAQIWLKNITKTELYKWIKDINISLNPTLRVTLQRQLYQIQDNDKPFQDPYYWAAFCAIGK